MTVTTEDALPEYDDPEPVHGWFGLTYSNYLVLQRAILESMPVEWQRRFVKCLNELRQEVDAAKLDVPSDYRVTALDERGRFRRDPIPHYRRAPNVFGKERL